MHIDTNGPMGVRISRSIWNISFLSRKSFSSSVRSILY
ncbi:hypothetical protein Golob_027598 [Gossypium lobatum]|uniref:Uncharacterized protein n=1 Tax=Gossypium lobatum TaxID=34289 RepID=A0A7J8NLD0_9ROSI|nr:hypothetical protein [Gossypium lobatum]